MKESKHMMELYKQIHEELERERKDREQIIKHNEMVIRKLRNLGYLN